jgi:uncharacterized protein YkwD
MKTIVALIVLLFLTSFRVDPNIIVDESEAQKAFALLNDIRGNPKKYENEMPFLKDLSMANQRLVWNETLAGVAEAKAVDMADKNYFAHVDPSGYGINHYVQKAGYELNPDWTKNKRENNFESLAAGDDTGEDAIYGLIIDDGVPSLGHRRHLLGLTPWDSTLVDVGIGFVRRPTGSEWQSYCVVIIAKHDWSDFEWDAVWTRKEIRRLKAEAKLKLHPKGSHRHLFKN